MNETARERDPVDPGPGEELIFRAPELRQRSVTDGGCGAPPPDFLLSSWQILKEVLTKRTAQDEIESDTSPLTEFTFQVPELLQRPVIGGGCCAIPAEFLIEVALKQVEQVREVDVSDGDGTVRIWAIEDDSGLSEQLKDHIERLGYRVAESTASTAQHRSSWFVRISEGTNASE